MFTNEIATTYHEAHRDYILQEGKIQDANGLLQEFENSGFPIGEERDLRRNKLFQNLTNEQSKIDDLTVRFNKASQDLMDKLNRDKAVIGSRISFDISERSYFEVDFLDHNRIQYLGPYSRM